MGIFTKEVSGMDCDMVVENFANLGGTSSSVSYSASLFTVPRILSKHFSGEWRDGKIRGKASTIHYYMFDHKTGGKLEGSDALLPGYKNTLNQDVSPYPRTEACRRFDISASGRRYDFEGKRGGLVQVILFNFSESAFFLSRRMVFVVS